MVAGVFIFGLGLLGIWLSKCKGCCSTTLFIVLATVLTLILIVIGTLLGGFVKGRLLGKIKNKMCKKAGDVFIQYRDTVDKSMCSYDCPCPKGTNNNV
jgi:hypothetical protein